MDGKWKMKLDLKECQLILITNKGGHISQVNAIHEEQVRNDTKGRLFGRNHGQGDDGHETILLTKYKRRKEKSL